MKGKFTQNLHKSNLFLLLHIKNKVLFIFFNSLLKAVGQTFESSRARHLKPLEIQGFYYM